MIKIFFSIITAILLLTAVNLLQAASIAAVVNKKAITDYDILQKAYIFLFLSNRPMPGLEEMKIVSKQFIDPAINDEIKMQIVNEYNDRLKDSLEPKIAVGDEQLNHIVESIAKRHKVKNKEALYKLLSKYQINSIIFEEALRGELLWSELVRRAVYPTVRIFESEVNHCVNIQSHAKPELKNAKEYCHDSVLEEKVDMEVRKIVNSRRHLAFLEIFTK